MKKVVILLSFFFFGAVGMAQQPIPTILTSYNWLLTSDEMTGSGNHETLPKDIQLSFTSDGKWSATHPLFNKQSKGTWETDKGGKWILKAGGKTASIALVTDDKMQIVYEQRSSKVTLTWEPAK